MFTEYFCFQLKNGYSAFHADCNEQAFSPKSRKKIDADSEKWRHRAEG